jgi:hypothetical protein
MSDDITVGKHKRRGAPYFACMLICLGMRLIFRSAHSFCHGITFAHVCAVLCLSVKSGSAKVVDL